MFKTLIIFIARSFWVTEGTPNPGRSFPHWRASMGLAAVRVLGRPTTTQPRVPKPRHRASPPPRLCGLCVPCGFHSLFLVYSAPILPYRQASTQMGPIWMAWTAQICAYSVCSLQRHNRYTILLHITLHY